MWEGGCHSGCHRSPSVYAETESRQERVEDKEPRKDEDHGSSVTQIRFIFTFLFHGKRRNPSRQSKEEPSYTAFGPSHGLKGGVTEV